jgi:hypothetical protein
MLFNLHDHYFVTIYTEEFIKTFYLFVYQKIQLYLQIVSLIKHVVLFDIILLTIFFPK